MRTTTALILFLGLTILFSCNGVNVETYCQAAQETCSCMNNLKTENQHEANSQNDGLHYALCTMDIEIKYKLDVQDEAFESALKAYCPDLLHVHENVVRNSIQLQNQSHQ